MASIAIIGTGRMAKGLGTGWAKAGHSVVFGSREPGTKAGLTEAAPGALVTGQTDALQDAEVVVLAIPFGEVEGFASANAAALRGKLVVDISNPMDRLADRGIAGAQVTADAIGEGARVVAAFKDNFFDTLLEPNNADGIARDVHFAGDSEADKEQLAGLVLDLGFRPVDCGPLKNARVLDGMVPLIVALDRKYHEGRRQSSWHLLG